MSARSEQTGVFLRACRARLEPHEVGLPKSLRSRSAGLRREDVAALAGVSLNWYTLLEQGRPINVSAELLERVCAALRLSRDEREYLFSLVHGRPAPRLSEHDTRITEALELMLQYMPLPALVMTLRWDIVAWNRLITTIFRDYAQIEPDERNLLRIILTDRNYQQDTAEYESLARFLLSKFRVDFSQATGDAAFEDLIAELREAVPNFEALWRAAEILPSIRGYRYVRHPRLGDLSFEQSSYVPEGSSFLRLLMFVPCDQKTADVLGKLAAEAYPERVSQLPAVRRRDDSEADEARRHAFALRTRS